MVRFLLKQPRIEYISSKFNQDPLEEYFGKQRAIGRRTEYPTAKQFIDNAATLRVVKSAGITNLRVQFLLYFALKMSLK